MAKKRVHKYNASAKKGKRSNLEVFFHSECIKREIEVLYESVKFTLIEPTNALFTQCKKGVCKIHKSSRPTTYTPDFILPKYKIIVETKGIATPDFAIKWKLFLSILPSTDYRDYTTAIIFNNKSIINFLDSLVNEKSNATA